MRLFYLSGRSAARSEMFTTKTVANFLLALGAFVLAGVTAGFSYSFWWKVGFVSAGTLPVWILLWRWGTSKEWALMLKILVSCVGALLFVAVMIPPLEHQFNEEFNIQLDFKDSPAFTEWIQIRTRYDLSNFRNYLQDLELSLPMRTVSFEVKGGEFANGSGVYLPPDKTYEWTIQIGENEIHDREEVTSAYLRYVLSRVRPPFPNDPLILAKFLQVELGVELYIDASYWNERKPQLFASPIFWQIRSEFGKSFGDRLAIRTLGIYSLGSKPDFCSAVKDADSSIDSDSAKWSAIAKIMHVSENCTPLN